LAQIILISFLIFSIAGLILKIILNRVNSKYIRQHANQVPKGFEEKIDLENHQKAQRYSIAKLNFGIVSNLIAFISLYISLFFIYGWVDEFVRSNFEYSSKIQGLIFFGILSLISMIVSLPESIYSTFVLEEKFGFNKTTPKIFLIDIFKGILLSCLIGAPFLYFLLYLMESLGELWWLAGASAFLVFQFFLIWAYPKFIAPLFNKFTPLKDVELEKEMNALIERANLSFKDYYVMNASLRSSHGNAYFTGFGKNKRIVFFDTLLKTLSTEEVIAVMAHELGHLKHKHIIKSLMKSIVFLYIGFYILGLLSKSAWFYQIFSELQPSNYMALTLFSSLVPIYTFFLTPLFSWLSRKNEYEADKFACDHANGQDLINALIKMYKDNSSTLTPHPTYSKFYFSHPPALERINYIRSCIN
tara:strand:+ start:69892 stop:71139 length:1248 start_codon:yes stop_codon:yes gene_type:complete